MADAADLYMLGAGLDVGSKLSKGQSSFAESETAHDIKEYQAKGYERAAGAERAQGGRMAFEQRNKLNEVRGKQLAIAAASGAAVDSPSIVDIMADTEARGAYLAKTEIAKGENKARGDLDKAAVARAEGDAALKRGKAARTASYIDAASSALKAKYDYEKKFKGRRRKSFFDDEDGYDPKWGDTSVSFGE